MSYHPEQPGSRPMPPNYSQASGPQQPYAPQGQQYSQPQTHSGQTGSGGQSGFGSQWAYGAQPGYSEQPTNGGQPGFGARPGYGRPQMHNPAMFDSRSLPEQAYGPGSEQFWMAHEPDRTTALWAHLGSLIFGFMPLIMFLVKKDESPFVREHSRQGLNAMITNTIVTFGALFVFGFVGFILALVTFGIGIIVMYAALIVPLVYCVFYIIAAVAANKGEGYKFPLTINFVK
ncbi:DUF4870 domain-containing protein [Brevibacterium permense]|uniref:DUF4870 domain-containing protein n=1 Tax=Brevibacterium permense TaxID=234834 RepID=UPI0021CFC7A3|nr:DUF4870 domain-containing protein [Brevibacterium permense]MCU4298002.1 DUF4870 domain-containing protein [Brevibacterium permense]